MQKMKSYLALSGCPPRAPCQESFILSETCSPQIGRKTLDRQTQGQLPCLALYVPDAVLLFRFKIIIIVSQYTCQIVYADADVMLILMLMLILMMILSLVLISMLMKLINQF